MFSYVWMHIFHIYPTALRANPPPCLRLVGPWCVEKDSALKRPGANRPILYSMRWEGQGTQKPGVSDAFVDSPIQTMPRFIRRFINVSNASDVVVLLSCSVVFNLLCSCFVNLGVVFGAILSVSGSILMSFWWPWGSFGDPVPSRGPPKRAESKM